MDSDPTPLHALPRDISSLPMNLAATPQANLRLHHQSARLLPGSLIPHEKRLTASSLHQKFSLNNTYVSTQDKREAFEYTNRISPTSTTPSNETIPTRRFITPWVRRPATTAVSWRAKIDIPHLCQQMSLCSLTDDKSTRGFSAKSASPTVTPTRLESPDRVWSVPNHAIGFQTTVLPAPLPSFVNLPVHKSMSQTGKMGLFEQPVAIFFDPTSVFLHSAPLFATRSHRPSFTVPPISTSTSKKRVFSEVEEAFLPSSFVTAMETNKRRKLAGFPHRRPQASPQFTAVPTNQLSATASGGSSPTELSGGADITRSSSSSSLPDLIADLFGTYSPTSSRSSSFAASPDFQGPTTPPSYEVNLVSPSPAIFDIDEVELFGSLGLDILASAADFQEKVPSLAFPVSELTATRF